MKIERRDFLRSAGLATVAGFIPGLVACNGSSSDNDSTTDTARAQNTSDFSAAAGTNTWEGVRGNFQLDPDFIHMAGLLLASHPEPVREAISRHRQNLNENPANYVNDNFSDGPRQVRESAGAYMGVHPEELALTDSTTMGTALVINGIQIRGDQDMLSAEFDYYSTHESIRFKAERTGASARKVPIYQDSYNATEDEIVDRLTSEIRDNTRLLTGTWVHSSTGLKIPVRKIADRVAEINAGRNPEDRVLFFVDGVHGFGVEQTPISELGCDFFSAGTHKWMFGPRGTGVLWGNSRSHNQITPTIPTFTNGAGWGGKMTPGGFKPFEHQWAMAQAFDFHRQVGKERVQDRIYEFSRQIKEELRNMDHVTLYTPMEENLSSGVICFDIDGLSPGAVVNRLADQKIIASDTPYDHTHARLTPAIYNTPQEIEEVIKSVRSLK